MVTIRCAGRPSCRRRAGPWQRNSAPILPRRSSSVTPVRSFAMDRLLGRMRELNGLVKLQALELPLSAAGTVLTNSQLHLQKKLMIVPADLHAVTVDP